MTPQDTARQAGTHERCVPNTVHMQTAIEQFVLYLEAERGYSGLTSRSYRSDLRLFCDWLSQQQPEPSLEQVSLQTVRGWLVEMKSRGLAGTTIARRVHALRSFWRYLRESEIVEHDPLLKIRLPRRERALPEYLRAEELRALLDAAQRHPDVLVGIRNYALMATCIYTGVRRGELINLRLGDFDAQAGLLRVRGKGGKWRMIPLAPEAVGAIADWLELRPGGRGHDYLFTTVRGNRIHPTRMQRIWRTILGASGLQRSGISLHTLRHSAATLLLQTGTCDLVQIQRLLGHSRLDTTALYLHLEPRDLQAAMQRHPLGREG